METFTWNKVILAEQNPNAVVLIPQFLLSFSEQD